MGLGKSERELERGIDSMMEEIDGMYRADLKDEERLDSKMGDISLRDELIGHIREVVRCRKISERMMAEQSKDVRYTMSIEVSRNGMSYSVVRRVCTGMRQ